MKMTVKRSLLIGIAILQSHFWIVLTQEAFKGIDTNSENNTNSSDEKPKKAQDENVLQTSLLLFISSSLLTIATSSVLGGMDYSKSHSTHTPFIPGTAILVDADPLSLLKNNFQHSFIDATLSHQNSHLATPNVGNVPTSYLLNSSYLLESYNLLENSFYLLKNSSSHVSDKVAYHSASFSPQSINLSSSYDSYAFVEKGLEEIHPTSFSEYITQTPTAESRILTMTSSYTSKKYLTHERIRTSESSPPLQTSKTQNTATNNPRVQDEHVIDSYTMKEENSNFKGNKPTVSLSEKVNTDFSNFFIETRIVSPTSRPNSDSTMKFSELPIRVTFPDEVTSLKVSTLILNSDSVKSSSVVENNDSKNKSHEIITDDSSEKNKTFRNEDAEIDDIISGIIHLLAGNVQVVRPTNNGYGVNPTRLHLPLQPSLVSTRINNRGPIRPNSFSRTVVVFSQPPNKGHPTELALPGHLVPSTLQNPQFVRIRPTKVGEHPPSAVSVIHFYKQGPKPPGNQPPQPPQIPFRGEVFNPNRPNTHVRIPAIPNEYVRPSFINPEKQQPFNGNVGNKYPHFIFSDQAASSVVLIRPSKPPLAETFEKFSPELPKKQNTINKNTPSQSFEVLIDDTMKKKVFVSQIDSLSVNSHNINPIKTSHNTNKFGAQISATTTEKDIVPHGPVTDWVPFAERPSVRDSLNGTNALAADSNVSIIMHPVIFDLTVSNSMREVLNSKNSTLNQNFPLPVTTETTTTSVNRQPTITSETTRAISVSKTESVKLSSKTISYEYSQSDIPLSQTRSTINDTRQVLETQRISNSPLKTVDIISTPTINVTRQYDRSESHTITTSSKPDLRSSFSHGIGSFFTEKRAFVENTESAAFPSRFTSSIPVPIQTSKTIEITPSSSSSSSQKNEQTLLGRPIVIPVDIEEVRPFVGPINPPSSDRNRDNPYQGSFPGLQGSTTDDSVRKTVSSTTRTPIIRSQARPRPNTVRIDTCIVGDDSTCDVTLNETCKTELGISSCHCRPGYARSYARGPCIPIVSLMLSMKVDRFGNKKVAFSPKYLDKNSDEYRVMEFEAKLALTSLISQIPAFSRTFQGMRINTFYPIGEKLVINSTIFLEEKESTRTQAVRLRLRQLIGEAIKNRKQNIGESRLYVEGSFSPVTAIEDVNECSDSSLNDCAEDGLCFNVFGTYLCKCRTGYVDPFVHDERRSGRKCSACSPEYCSFHGKCFVERDKRLCKCHGNYIGSRCEIDGEVLGVALGASLAAIIIILLTLGCLCIWNRKWKQQQQKAEVLSSRSYNSNQTFSYMGNMMNANANPYHLTMEDRMRWAQISDVIKNISVQPNPEHPYMPPAPQALDQAAFSNRCQPSDDEVSWYECRTRPRSRVMGQYGGVSGPSCFEMDISSRGGPYGGTGYHSSKRHKHSAIRY